MRHFKCGITLAALTLSALAFAHPQSKTLVKFEARSAPIRWPRSARLNNQHRARHLSRWPRLGAAPPRCRGRKERPHLRARLRTAAGHWRRDRHRRPGDAGGSHTGVRPGGTPTLFSSAAAPLDAAGNFRIDSEIDARWRQPRGVATQLRQPGAVDPQRRRQRRAGCVVCRRNSGGRRQRLSCWSSRGACLLHRHPAGHANFTCFSGRLRTGLPVAAWIALSTLGVTTQIVGSPTPPQKSCVGTITVSTFGNSASLRIG